MTTNRDLWRRVDADLHEDRDARQLMYVDVPISVAPYFPRSEPRLSDPFLYVAGRPIGNRAPYDGQSYATAATVGLLMAEYGMGKSELMMMLKWYIDANHELLGGRRAVLVELGSCRDRVTLLEDRLPGDRGEMARLFGQLIFGSASQADSDYEQRRADVREGAVVLLLDGLDELLPYRNRDEYLNFYRALASFAGQIGKGPEDVLHSLVLVSMRREFLISVGDEGIAHAAKVFPSTLGVDHLMLSPFTMSHVACFLEHHFARCEAGLPSGQTIEALIERIRNNDRLREMLARPLLLKLWCDILPRLEAKAFDLSHEAELFEEYVETASREQTEKYQGWWDLEKLSAKAKDLYMGSSVFEIPTDTDDIQSLLKESSEGKPTDLQLAIHKCPFLQDTGKGTLRFAHRAFFEYFTARGVRDCAKNGDYEPFNDLVLNTDMRKFLRFLLKPEKFNQLAHKAWGLEDPTWRLSEEDRRSFEDWHGHLLKSMTTKETRPQEVEDLRRSIIGFLERLERGCVVHPEYTTYAFESIGRHFTGDTKVDVVDQWDRFSDVLKKCGNRLVKLLKSLHPDEDGRRLSQESDIVGCRNDYEILLEKVLELGTRLHLDWVRSYRSKDILPLVRNEKTQARMARILDRQSRL